MAPRKPVSSRPRIGLALGSGGARGWAHVGIVETLEEAGIVADVVCGTSMGALVGAVYAAGGLPALHRFARELDRRGMAALADVKLTRGGLLDGGRVVGLLKKMGVDGPISGLAMPYAAIATDLETGREVQLRKGPVLDAVRASIAIPGVLSPVRIGDRWLADGGMVNPVPISACRALGADFIIAVNLNNEVVRPLRPNAAERLRAGFAGASAEVVNRLVEQVPQPFREQVSTIAPKLLRPRAGAPSYFDVLINAINIMEEQITRARLADEPPDILIDPEIRAIRPFEFNRAGEAIAKGRAAAARALPEIRRLMAPYLEPTGT